MTSARKQLNWIVAALVILLSLAAVGPASANEGTPGKRIGVGLSFGQDGDNQTTMPTRPTGTYWSAISSGITHSIALASDGTAHGFGNSADNRINIPVLSSGQRYTAVAAGGTHSLLLTSAGTIRAIGSNSTGQTTVPNLGSGLRYTAIAAGSGFSVAVVSDGTLRAWGFNNHNQVSSVPAPQTNAKFISVAAGNSHAIALQDNGQVKTWGRNTETQLQVPVPVQPSKYTAVDASGNRSLALRSDGKIFGAGEAVGGEKAPATQGFDLFVDLAVGDDFGFGLTESGKLVSFGANDHGQRDVPFIGPALQASSIDAGANSTFAILAQKPTVTIESEANPARYGEPLGVTVKVGAGSDVPTGQVRLLRSGTPLGTNSLSNGQRRFTPQPSQMEVGSNFFYAEYAGDNRTVPGRATALNVTVTKAQPELFLMVPKQVTTAAGSQVLIRVEAGTAALEGSLKVKSGNKELASVNMNAADSGEKQIMLPRFTKVGNHPVSVEFGGSPVSESASSQFSLSVDKAKTKVELKLAKPKVKFGQKTKLTGQVTIDGELKPSGKVVIKQGKKKLGTVKINPKNGRFNLKLPAFKSKGKRVFLAEYQGNNVIEKSKRKATLQVTAAGR